MGKALLLIVLSSSLVLVTQLFSTVENESKTAEDQRGYQEEVIAREIAQSAFNVGMGEVRAHGERVQAGALALNGSDNAGREGVHTTGRFAGGSYSVRAELTSGHSVRVVATGTYGGASFTMHDEYRVPVLTARHDGLIDVSFLDSMAGYCSAVFYRAYTLDMAPGTVPEAIMLFAADNRDRRTARPSQQIWVEAGTQMNFFIGVDENCSMRLTESSSSCEARSYVQNYTFNPSDFDHVHYALEVSAGELDQAYESMWGIVEQHPDNRQRWRIGWEDQHNTSWNQPSSTDWTESLQATKTYGYYGTGWPSVDARKYRLLEDFGSRPDFSDQVIEIHVIPATDPSFFGRQTAARAQQAQCGEPIDAEVVPPPAVITDPQILQNLQTIETALDGATMVATPVADDDLTTFACQCKNNGVNNAPLLHRPPGNEANEQLLCLPQPARVNAHLKNHNDVELTCTERRNIRTNNGNGNKNK